MNCENMACPWLLVLVSKHTNHSGVYVCVRMNFLHEKIRSLSQRAIFFLVSFSVQKRLFRSPFFRYISFDIDERGSRWLDLMFN